MNIGKENASLSYISKYGGILAKSVNEALIELNDNAPLPLFIIVIQIDELFIRPKVICRIELGIISEFIDDILNNMQGQNSKLMHSGRMTLQRHVLQVLNQL